MPPPTNYSLYEEYEKKAISNGRAGLSLNVGKSYRNTERLRFVDWCKKTKRK